MSSLSFFRTTDQKVGTQHGGILSTIAIISIIVLSSTEVYLFFFGDYVLDIQIDDVSFNQKLRVDLNISVFSLPCEGITIEYLDAMGNYYPDYDDNLYKIPIDQFGVIKSEMQADQLRLREARSMRISHREDCGSCYGADMVEDQCCNTCDDVFAAYRQRGWEPPPANSIKQCQGRKLYTIIFLSNPFMASQETSGGCQLFGHLMVSKVPGSFSITLNQEGVLMQVYRQDIDASHQIHNLAISDPDNPSKKTTTSVQDYLSQGFSKCDYYMKVSPASMNGAPFYETSVNTKETKDDSLFDITFMYEVEPLLMVYHSAKSWGQLLVSLCGIIGGVFALAKFWSAVIDKLT